MWVVRLSDKQLEVVRAVLRSEEHRGPALEGALEPREHRERRRGERRRHHDCDARDPGEAPADHLAAVTA